MFGLQFLTGSATTQGTKSLDARWVMDIIMESTFESGRTSVTHTPVDQQDAAAFQTLVRIAGAAIVTLSVALLAGLVLLIVEPESGSTTEGVLGVTAAIAGLATGAFAITAAIYAQVKNLWKYVPSWVRGLVWTFVVLGIITTVVNLINQLF